MTIKRLAFAVTSNLSRGPIDVDAEAGVLIPGVKFPTAFSLGAIEGTAKTYKVKFLKERWAWFNAQLFGGVMAEPNFVISKNFKDIKALGTYTSIIRELMIHPKLWDLKSESVILGTLVHEMAHQYEFEHEHRPPGEDVHGQTWQSIMARVGMPTRAKFLGKDKDSLMDHKERKVTERFDTVVQKAKLSDFERIKNFAMYVDKVRGRETPLIIVGPYHRSGSTREYVPGFAKTEVNKSTFSWFDLTSVYIPDKLQVMNFPAELLGAQADAKANAVSQYLTADPKA